MCCFAGHVSSVSATKIFARIAGDREYLVYEMTFTSAEPTAMILPIPVAPGTPDEVVEFVALDAYPEFFRDLERQFQRDRVLALGGGLPNSPLPVHRVGAFEASFVPHQDAFDRLDARFTIPRHVWQQIPAYQSYGFVVFKLQPGKRVGVHPMAFSFRTRDPRTLFYPSLHVHDGMVHEYADFEHILYTQNTPARQSLWRGTFWLPDDKPASEYMNVARANGLIDRDVSCSQMVVVGRFANQDILVPI